MISRSGLKWNHRLMQPHRQATADEVVERDELVREFVKVDAEEMARPPWREPETQRSARSIATRCKPPRRGASHVHPAVTQDQVDAPVGGYDHPTCAAV